MATPSGRFTAAGRQAGGQARAPRTGLAADRSRQQTAAAAGIRDGRAGWPACPERPSSPGGPPANNTSAPLGQLLRHAPQCGTRLGGPGEHQPATSPPRALDGQLCASLQSAPHMVRGAWNRARTRTERPGADVAASCWMGAEAAGSLVQVTWPGLRPAHRCESPRPVGVLAGRQLHDGAASVSWPAHCCVSASRARQATCVIWSFQKSPRTLLGRHTA